MLALVTFTALCTAIYYLTCRAAITEPIWKRYPAFLDRLARCPACSGWWLGALVALYVSPIEPHITNHTTIERAILGALFGLVLTPLGTYLVIVALERTTIPDPTSSQEEPRG
jgi:multisubunit Na+/H+ antiporter MnhG subunit